MSRENADAARRSFEGWNRGDIDAWLESAHPDVEFHSEIARRIEGAGAVVRGTAGMRRFWDEWHLVWDMRIDVSEVRDLGETVLVFARLRAHGGASGVDLEGPVAYVLEFKGGLIRTVRTYLDPQQALEVLDLPE